MGVRKKIYDIVAASFGILSKKLWFYWLTFITCRKIHIFGDASYAVLNWRISESLGDHIETTFWSESSHIMKHFSQHLPWPNYNISILRSSSWWSPLGKKDHPNRFDIQGTELKRIKSLSKVALRSSERSLSTQTVREIVKISASSR